MIPVRCSLGIIGNIGWRGFQDCHRGFGSPDCARQLGCRFRGMHFTVVGSAAIPFVGFAVIPLCGVPHGVESDIARVGWRGAGIRSWQHGGRFRLWHFVGTPTHGPFGCRNRRTRPSESRRGQPPADVASSKRPNSVVFVEVRHFRTPPACPSMESAAVPDRCRPSERRSENRRFAPAHVR